MQSLDSVAFGGFTEGSLEGPWVGINSHSATPGNGPT